MLIYLFNVYLLSVQCC